MSLNKLRRRAEADPSNTDARLNLRGGRHRWNLKRRRSLRERFDEKVCHSADLFSCWEWRGSRDRSGYGMIWLDTRMHRSHRISWELSKGPIPKGLWVLHRCDNPPCVRPGHLFLGNVIDNVRDMMAKGRYRQGAHNPRRGENSPHSKLTDDKAREIRALYKSGGHSYSSLARRFGVAKSTIECIVRRKKWAHVADVPGWGMP